MPAPTSPFRPPRFIPALEGMRALAALGVLTTHVAFQTRSVDGSVTGAVWGRLDLAVALFFSLSGFLLWRPHAAAARGGPPAPPVGRYLRHRAVRILPAYLVVVLVVLSVVPAARGAGPVTWLANLSLLQVYVPYSLVSGLTQMWSLAVEVSFYAVLPLLAWAIGRLRGPRAHLRIPVMVGVAVVSLGWAFVATRLPLADGVSATLWLPGYLPWFVAGTALAEVAASDTDGRLRRWSSRRVPMGVLAVGMYALACTPIAGPSGLAAVSDGEFATKTVIGAVLGWALLAPLVLSPAPHRFLASTAMQTLGRWSYAIFIWHLAVLAVVFPVFGFAVFGGAMWAVWIVTVLVTIGVAAASYGLVEDPARRAMRDRERRDAQRVTNPRAGDDTVARPATATSAGSVTHQSNPV
ncbi:Peptidoglycan/LPS O-acetylase OafA/YrhL, contains acyltransferase and SGNH-hydrolase domains [Williamsia deligens]|nr:Peptidoglycan/LPS O-acetylase OafA/YrhL, contains acyltransferase and SGNH-hydrolase domains [Williamsia deligens]